MSLSFIIIKNDSNLSAAGPTPLIIYEFDMTIFSPPHDRYAYRNSEFICYSSSMYIHTLFYTSDIPFYLMFINSFASHMYRRASSDTLVLSCLNSIQYGLN